MKLNNFELIDFNLDDKNHAIFLNKIISSPNSELISCDMKINVNKKKKLKKMKI